MWSRVKAWFGFGPPVEPVEPDEALTALLDGVTASLDEVAAAACAGDEAREAAARAGVLQNFETMVATVRICVERLVAADLVAEPVPDPDPELEPVAPSGSLGLDRLLEQHFVDEWARDPAEVNAYRHDAVMRRMFPSSQRPVPELTPTAVLLQRLGGNGNGNQPGFDADAFWGSG
jgi:hypothetical protein